MPANGALGKEQQDQLQLLYPWYKAEVFRRRERMMWLTAYGSGILLLVLIAVHTIPTLAPAGAAAGFVCIGVLLFAGIMVYLILQQRSRYLMAKRVLIEIERQLGLYEEGRFLPNGALYPKEWQTAWTQDVSVVIYLAVLAGLTGVVIVAALWR